MERLKLRDLPRLQINFLGGEPGHWMWMVNDKMMTTRRDPSDLRFFSYLRRTLKIHGFISIVDKLPFANSEGWWMNVVEGSFVFGCFVPKGALKDTDIWDFLKAAQKQYDETTETVH